MAAERAVQHAAAVVAAAAQQAAQLEAERAAAQAAIAEAEQQRRHAEEQLAAQQAHLAQLQTHIPPAGDTSPPQQIVMPPSSTPGPLPAFNSNNNIGSQPYQMLNGNGSAQTAPPSGITPTMSPSPQPSATDYYQTAMNAAAGGGPRPAPPAQHGTQFQGLSSNNNFQSHPSPLMPQGIGGAPPLPPQPPMSQPQPLGCEFCGRWLSEMALDQGNHMCDEFWQYSAEFQAVGAKSALLIGGVQHLKPEHLQSLAARFPNMRKVKHGPGFSEFNGLFTLSDEQGQLQALRLLLACGVRTIPLGHAASWRCLHVQLAPGNSPQRVGQAEQALQNQLHRLLHPDGPKDSPLLGGPSAGRGKGAADAWAQRANDAQRRLDPQQHPSQYFVNPPMPPGGSSPGSTPGDWKCPNCANINFAFREKCNRCNTPRPGAKLFGPMQQSERRICPFTVMLMRVPPQATEAQVAEALLQFGEIAAGGIKFHRQGAKFKQRRGRLPPDGLALHAFCRFLRPASASAALQRGEFTIFGQPVQINPAFMRGAMPADALAAAEMPPLPPNVGGGPVPPDWGQPTPPWQQNSSSESLEMREPGIYGQLASLNLNDGGSSSKHQHLTHFLHVAMQVLWQFKDFRAQIMALPPSSDPLVSGVQTIMVSLSEQRNSPLSTPLLHTALHGVYAEQTKFDQVNDACEALEVVVGKFCASPDRRFAGCVEQLLGMNIMEMCECKAEIFLDGGSRRACGEMLEPMTYKQSACFVSVPALLGAQPGQPGSLLHQLSTAAGPNCPLPNCAKQMVIQRYLMQPTPQVLAVSFTYDSMGDAAYEPNVLGAVFARVETHFDLQRTYKGVAQPTMANLVGMLCCTQGVPTPRYSAFFFDGTARQWCMFDDASNTPIGPDWAAVAAHCPQSQLQPAVLFYQVQHTCLPCSSAPDSAPPQAAA